MVFSSLLFLFIYLPVILVVYYVAPRKIRNLILFLGSLVFYAWGEPVYVCLMLFSTLVDFIHGLLVERFQSRGQTRRAKGAVASSVIINLGLLGFFKYSDFLVANVNALLGTSIPLLRLPLPIGISFYTFQTMSYTIDIYRGEARAQHNILDFGTYVALFPQLIAGPIVRYGTAADQLTHRRETVDSFAGGVQRFVVGLGKKVLLANTIGLVWSGIQELPVEQMPALTAWLGLLAFGFQIYFDFSGYSDMAIGLGNMFGFHFHDNFQYPYESKSITEFWRRWHISLGTWFKEYVYIPLGGNRKGLGKQIRNIAIVWALTGIWHGASWNFLLWGVYFGILLMMEKLFLLPYLRKAPSWVSHVYTLLAVLFGWLLFAFESLPQGLGFLKAMFGGFGAGFVNGDAVYLLYTNATLMIILVVGSTQLPKRLLAKAMELLQRHENAAVLLQNIGLVAIFLISTAYLVDATYNPFLYFRF